MNATLIFPHQLFWPHPAVEKGRRIFLVEDSLFFGTDTRWPMRMHHQKLALHRASMQAFAEKLRNGGHHVSIVECPAKDAHTVKLLEAALPKSIRDLTWVDPVDQLLTRRVKQFADKHHCKLTTLETPMFLTPKEFLNECFPKGKKPFMAHFYQKQRQRMDVLMTKKGTPVGGHWSFDADNRKRLPRGLPIPPLPSSTHDWTRISRKVLSDFPHSIGEVDGFNYPVTHEAAEKWLADFLKMRLSGFGAYEDAISTRHPVIFHSVITPALNIGLLTPEQVIKKTLGFASSHDIPLNSLEGFIRQIIGWREFMRAMYERKGTPMRTSNYWGFRRRMPSAFYTARTGIEPIDQTIRKVLRMGYCHHIERLMLLGNFMLLCRIHPDDVYLWFMEMFIDSYDWVMVPNVYGMSQFSDGGGFTTKPYISGSNYVLKMSDYQRGPWCDVWDALFWTFIADHHEIFASNPRLKMMTLLCDKLGPKLASHRKVAEKFLASLT